MKVAAATSFLFATLALASPAPVAQPEAAAVALAQPMFQTREQFHDAVAARDADAIHKIQLDARAKKPKGSNNGNNSNSSSAAVTIAPTRALQLGALGFGVLEVVRLWG